MENNKIFVSYPFKDLSKDVRVKIKETLIEEFKKFEVEYEGMPKEFIETFEFVDNDCEYPEAENIINPSIYYRAKAFEKIADCVGYIGIVDRDVKGKYNGCYLENLMVGDKFDIHGYVVYFELNDILLKALAK